MYVRIRPNSVGRYSDYLSGYISRGSSIQIHINGIIKMDELALGLEENSTFVQFYFKK